MSRTAVHPPRAAVTPAAAPSGPRRRRPRAPLTPYLFVLPAVLFLGALLGYPIVINVVTSFQAPTAMNLLSGDAEWVGLENYRTTLDDPLVVEAAVHSAQYTVASVVLQMALGLGLALLYGQTFPGARSMRSLYLIGYAIPVVVSAQVFRWMLDGRTGFVNWLLQAIHLQQPDAPVYWLDDTQTALFALVAVQAWLGVPFTMIALASGLTVVPGELYEAARMDGTSTLQRFRYVTWPHLRPTFLTVTLLTVIFSFKSFDLVWIATQGGPAGASETLPTLAYRKVFEQFQFGSGAAVLNAIFLVLLVLSVAHVYALHRAERTP